MRPPPPLIGIAVFMIVRRAGEILCLRRSATGWMDGRVSLPAGRHEGGETLVSAAIRETREEVALDLRRDGTIVGALDELRPRTRVLPPVIVRPFVATASSGATVEAGEEVADLFWAPLDAIVDPGATRETEILARGLRTRRPAIHYRGHVIWGMTERIIANLKEVLG